ncbi:MAG TPA: M20/M25/M40 family metallo-hydrolase [Candidatus Angelobacter sp.]|nr:M20/M25/M40 family metallo-hydrolase [Candidatus Angelobacter sp.]
MSGKIESRRLPVGLTMSFSVIPSLLLLSALLVLILAGSAASAQAGDRTDEQKRAYRSEMEQADQKIAEEVKAHSELVKNLEHLTTNIGARLTGSKQMQQASDWTLKRFHDYGVDAHLETTQIAHGWTRGIDTAEILTPVSQAMTIHALGWSKSTGGPVTGPVVVVEIDSPEDAAKYKGKLKGAIVLSSKPAEIPSDTPENAYDAVIPPARGVARPQTGGAGRRRLMSMLGEEGPAAVLLDSGKTDSLFNMTGAGGYNPSAVPIAFVTHENYSLVYRLAKSGPVTMKVDINGTFSEGPVPASITVGEIRGSQFPDERVIIGGHLDSWDLGQGALDNGTGSMAVLEAARALKSLGWKPKRTITFILFTGEEQGGVGADTFVKNHGAEIPKIDAALIHDTGTGKVFSIALENLYETAPLMTEIYEPLREVFELQPLSTRYFGSSDHVAFLRAGVPAYFCIQNPAHYREAHHSQTDTFDKVIPEEVNEGAALLAAWAWNVSEMPAALPHHAAAAPVNRGN